MASITRRYRRAARRSGRRRRRGHHRAYRYERFRDSRGQVFNMATHVGPDAPISPKGQRILWVISGLLAVVAVLVGIWAIAG